MCQVGASLSHTLIRHTGSAFLSLTTNTLKLRAPQHEIILNVGGNTTFDPQRFFYAKRNPTSRHDLQGFTSFKISLEYEQFFNAQTRAHRLETQRYDMAPYYGPDESPATVFLERSFLAGDFISGVGYGKLVSWNVVHFLFMHIHTRVSIATLCYVFKIPLGNKESPWTVDLPPCIYYLPSLHRNHIRNFAGEYSPTNLCRQS